MKDTDRILGALLEFKAAATERFDRLEHKVESIQGFKWKLWGGMAVIGFITSGILSLIKH